MKTKSWLSYSNRLVQDCYKKFGLPSCVICESWENMWRSLKLSLNGVCSLELDQNTCLKLVAKDHLLNIVEQDMP